MSEMMTTTTTNSPQESTESDSSKRDSTTSSFDLSDGSHGSSCSPPIKRPCLDDLRTAADLSDGSPHNDDNRNATIINGVDFTNMSDEEYVAYYVKLALSMKDKIVSPRLQEEKDDVMYAKLALSYYNDETGNDFELTRKRSLAPFPSREDRPSGGTHLNFFARPRGSEEEYLFYAEVQHWPNDPEIVDCYKFPYGTDDGVDLICHPPHVECLCEYYILGREDADDDEW